MRFLTSKFLSLAPCRVTSIVYILADPGGGGGGGTWVSFGWACAARDTKLAPRSKKISPKIDIQFLEVGQFFIPRSRIRPKTDTPF